jgi:hypothetical protein
MSDSRCPNREGPPAKDSLNLTPIPLPISEIP